MYKMHDTGLPENKWKMSWWGWKWLDSIRFMARARSTSAINMLHLAWPKQCFPKSFWNSSHVQCNYCLSFCSADFSREAASFFKSLPISLAAASSEPFCAAWYERILDTWIVPTTAKQALTAAKLEFLVSYFDNNSRTTHICIYATPPEASAQTYSMFFGLITKHHLVQILPVAIKAAFWDRESFSAGRRKSAAPARTTPHFITGAL